MVTSTQGRRSSPVAGFSMTHMTMFNERVKVRNDLKGAAPARRPPGADGGHVPGLASRILEPASLSQKVANAPMSFVKARATVVLRCVCTVG